MSNIVEYIEQKPWESQRLVGLKYEQLQQLLNNAKELHNKKLAEIQKENPRVIKAGGGRKIKLSVSEQIILTLIYLRGCLKSRRESKKALSVYAVNRQ